MTDGHVGVETPQQHSVALRAGEKVSLDPAGVPSSIDPVGEQSLAWRQGQLVYTDVRLETLLTDVSRYVPQTIISNSDVMNDRRVSAVMQLDDRIGMLDALAATLEADWKAVSDTLIILTPRS